MAVLDNKKPRQPIKTESVQYPIIIGLLLVLSLGALDNINLYPTQSVHKSFSVFNWSWATISESRVQDAKIIEAEKTLASVDKFQSQQKPVLIIRIMPEIEKIDYEIHEEYKTSVEIDKANLQKDLMDQESMLYKVNSGYRSLQSVQPSYPDAALKKGLTGFVKILFDLDDAGTPINIRIIESQPDGVFDQSVIQAVERSRFEWLEKNAHHSAIQQHFVFQLDTRRKR